MRRARRVAVTIDLHGLGKLIDDLFDSAAGPVTEHLVGERLRLTRLLSGDFVVHLSGDATHKRLEASTAWGGKRHRWFPDIRGRFESVRSLNYMLRDGYEKV